MNNCHHGVPLDQTCGLCRESFDRAVVSVREGERERMTLEKLLRMTVPVGPGCVAPEGTPMSPEFRVAVQEITDEGVRFIIHANGHNSETMDFIARGDTLKRLP
jgi:hypothetical protein